MNLNHDKSKERDYKLAKNWRVLMCFFSFFFSFFSFFFFLPPSPFTLFPQGAETAFFFLWHITYLSDHSSKTNLLFRALIDLLLHETWRLGFVSDRSSRFLAITYFSMYISPLYKHQVFRCGCLLTSLEEFIPGCIFCEYRAAIS